MGSSSSRFLQDFRVHNSDVHCVDYTILREGARPIELNFHDSGYSVTDGLGKYIELREGAVVMEYARFKINCDVENLFAVVAYNQSEFNRLVKFCKDTYDEKLGMATPLDLEKYEFNSKLGIHMVNIVPMGSFKARSLPYTTIVNYTSPSLDNLMENVNFAIHVDNSEDISDHSSSSTARELSDSDFISETDVSSTPPISENARRLKIKNFLQVESKVRFKKLKNLKTSHIVCFMNRKGEVYASAKMHLKVVREYSKANRADESIVSRLLYEGRDENSTRLAYFGSQCTLKRRNRCCRLSRSASSSSTSTLNVDYKSLETMHEHIPEVIPSYFVASDGTLLAYRQFIAPNAVANVIYIPPIGGDGKYRRIIGKELLQCNISTFILDVRGHGHSGGKRGHVSSPEQIWEDLRTIIRLLRWNWEGIPIFLAGDFISPGLILNYLCVYKKADLHIAGVCFINPLMSFMVYGKAEEEILRALNVKASNTKIALAYLTKGRIFGSNEVVKFKAFSKDFDDAVVDGLSTNMLMASQPPEGKEKYFIEKVNIPLGAWVGERNEILLPEKIYMLGEYAKKLSEEQKESKVIKDETNFSIFGTVSKFLGSFVTRVVSKYKVPPSNLSGKSLLNRPPFTSAVEAVEEQAIKELFTSGQETLHNFIEGVHGEPLGYRYLTPVKTPIAKIVLLSIGDMYVNLAVRLSQVNIIVYLADVGCMSSITKGKKLSGEERLSLLNNVNKHIRTARYMQPENIPLFVLAHGPLCQLLKGSVEIKENEFVDGFMFLSPLFVNGSDISHLTEKAQKIFAEVKQSTAVAAKSFFNFFVSCVHSLQDVSRTEIEDSLSSFAKVDLSGRKTSLLILCGNDVFVKSSLVSALKKKIDKVGLDPRSRVEVFKEYDFASMLIHGSDMIALFINTYLSTVSVPKEVERFDRGVLNETMFQFLETVGVGAIGKVSIARFKGPGKFKDRYFAIKSVRKSDVIQSGKAEAVRREKEILSMCHNPFIVSFVGSFVDKTSAYIVMEYVIGGELFTRLRLADFFDISAAKFYFAEILLAVEYLHAMNIVHRDIKPTNILISASGHLKLVDLDTSKVTSDGKCTTFCGTLQYMAPEIILRKPWYDAFCTDVYSLGIVAYELVFGDVPFRGGDAAALSHDILLGIPEHPSNKFADSISFVKELTFVDPSLRLGGKDPGAEGKSKISAVRSHEWLREMDFEALTNFQICPPFIPKYSSGKDSSNFVAYSQSADSFASMRSNIEIARSDVGSVFEDF